MKKKGKMEKKGQWAEYLLKKAALSI